MRKYFRKLLKPLGYDIVRWNVDLEAARMHQQALLDKVRDPLDDVACLLDQTRDPIVFDVGANVGQTIERLRAKFKSSTIYAFEPAEVSYRALELAAGDDPRTHLHRCAIGARSEQRTFIENNYSVMSSFLRPSSAAWGEVIQERVVEVDTVDRLLEFYQLGAVDLLKTDTQGYDLEVLKGATQSICDGRIKMIYLELIFSDMYEGQPSYHDVLCFLEQNNYRIVGMYDMHYRDGFLGWCDVLFVHRSLI